MDDPTIVTFGDCNIHKTAKIMPFVRIVSSHIGAECLIESFSYIYQASIDEHTKIMGHVFIPAGVQIGKHCFIGQGTMFVNTKYPDRGHDVFDFSDQYRSARTYVKDCVVIGANCTIGTDIVIGEGSFIGMGSVVTKSVPAYSLAYGVPAKVVKRLAKV